MQKIKTNIIFGVSTIVLAFSSIAGGLPILLSQKAFADSSTVINNLSSEGWTKDDTRTGGTVSLVNSAGAPRGTGALKLTTDSSTTSKAQFTTYFAPVSLSSVSNASLSYATKQNSAAFAGGDAAYQLYVNVNGTSGFNTFTYEPYVNEGTPAIHTGEWQTWNVGSGKFYSSHDFTGTGGSVIKTSQGTYTYTLDQIRTDFPYIKVIGMGVNIGSNNPSYNVETDAFAFNGTTYDFEPFTAPTASAQTSQTVLPGDLSASGWYYYDDNTDVPSITNTPGVHEVTTNPAPVASDNGAVKLDGSNGARNDIATNLYANTNLRDIAKIGFSTYQPNTNAGGTSNSPFMNFNVDLGTRLSGYQGRLVYVPETNASPLPAQNTWQDYEGVASNGQWTWSHFVSNGNEWPDGSTAQNRSWNDIISAFPNAKITNQLLVRSGEPYAYNFSAYIDHIYLATATNNINYNFELAPPSAPTNLRLNNTNGEFACGLVTNINSITPTWTAVAGAVSYNYKVVLPSGGVFGPVNVGNVTSVTGPFGAQGLSTFSVQAVDANGLTSDWATPCAVTYDATAPTMPTLLTPPNNGFKNTNDFYFTWTDSSDSGSAVTYEFQSSLNPAQINGVLTTGVWHSGSLSSPTIHSTGAPDGTWHWQVRAIDAAGNKSSWTAVWAITLDTQKPTVAISSPTNGQTVGHTLNIEGTASDTNFNYYYCYVTDAHGEVGTRDPQCVTAWAAGSLFHSAFAQTATGTVNGHLGSVDLTGLPSGTYQVHLVAYDKAGNSIEATPVSFVLDNTAPIVTDNFNVSMFTGDKVTLTPVVTGDTPVSYLWSVSDSKLSNDTLHDGSTLQIGPAPKGTYTVTLTVTDQSGNATVNAYTVTISTHGNTESNTVSGNTSTNTPHNQVVLGASTTDNSQTAPTENTTPESNGKVKGDSSTTPNTVSFANGSSTKDIKTSSNLLGLGWWWLPVVAIALSLFWFILGRRSDSNKQA